MSKTDTFVRNLKKETSKYLKNINDTINEGEVAFAQGLNNVFEKTTNAFEKTTQIPKRLKNSIYIPKLPKKKRDLSTKKGISSKEKPPAIGKVHVISIELLDFANENNGFVSLILFLEGVEKKLKKVRNPLIWEEKIVFDVCDEKSKLFIDVFSNQDFIGVVRITDFESKEYPLVDSYNSELDIKLKVCLKFEKKVKEELKFSPTKDLEYPKVSPREEIKLNSPREEPKKNENSEDEDEKYLEPSCIIVDTPIPVHNEKEDLDDDIKVKEDDIEEEDVFENALEMESKMKKLNFTESPKQNLDLYKNLIQNEGRINQLENQIEELSGTVRQLSQENKLLKIQVVESSEDILLFKTKMETLEKQMDILRSLQGRGMVEYFYLLLSYLMRFFGFIIVVIGWIVNKMKLTKDQSPFKISHHIEKNKEKITQLEQQFKEQSQIKFIPISEENSTEEKKESETAVKSTQYNWFEEMKKKSSIGGYESLINKNN